MILLQVIDSQWKDHLLEMDHLKEGIGLRGYGQRDPLVEYKKESYEMFQAMMDRVEEDALRYLFLIQPVVAEEAPQQPGGASGPCSTRGPEGGAAETEAPRANRPGPRSPAARRKN